MDHALEKKFPVNAKDYKLYEEIGEGVSATVYRALCIPLNEIVAIKVLDLEKCNNDLDGIRREVKTMSLINHPNLLKSHCSFTNDQNLWVVMPYMAGGSCMHIMKSAYPDGFDEPVIAILLHEVLKALVYLHGQGHIHRDVKSGNILVDLKGAVKLADFGVSACMFDTGDRQRSRNTFVGTPCWMAPEVMQQLHGYDFKADIWSFGITALELAHGHAPFSKYPPMKVLLLTLQNAPPGLDYERDKRFSKSFKELVGTCLVKDPKKRPTSEKLLKHPFFKQARSVNYLSRTILHGLTPLGDRFRILKEKDAAILEQNKALYEDKEQLSQKEYIRGISEWNFNLEDLKRQASMIQEDVDDDSKDSSIKREWQEDLLQGERLSPERSGLSNSASNDEDGYGGLHDLGSSLNSFPIKPLQALKGWFDVGEDDQNASTPSWKGSVSDSEEQLPEKSSSKYALDNIKEHHIESATMSTDSKTDRSEGLSQHDAQSAKQDPKELMGEWERDDLQRKCKSDNCSGQPSNWQKGDIGRFSNIEDASNGAVIQCKGRFKVTSTDLLPKGSASGFTTPNPAMRSILPSLNSILQQNAMQREEILKLMKHVEQMTDKQSETFDLISNELLQAPPATAKEKELQSLAIHLQQINESLNEDLHKHRTRNAQLEKHISDLSNQK
ncbi:hypothetical protein SAY87_004997 [Trapa incisa]|uniref:Protein kinase domain-containing protein n=1 Tax=Trapa incisa TaxID=236973 RepID=A0AAN7JPN7_9MYRT|nr:hypothetical protein SAY87_004997 [Trapa incisa]